MEHVKSFNNDLEQASKNYVERSHESASSRTLQRKHTKSSGILRAIEAGDFQAVANLLKDDPMCISNRNIYKANPLHMASIFGHNHIVSLLLDAKIDIDCKDVDDCTPLFWAIEQENESTVRLLLETGASFHVQDTRGMTPLMLAAEKGKEKIISVLLDKGATTNTQDKSGRTALMLAVQFGHAEAVNVLLMRSREDLNMVDSFGWSALLLAAWHGFNAILASLLDKGADLSLTVCTKNRKDWTALMMACQKGLDDTAKLLIEHGELIDNQDFTGWTPLMEAANSGYESTVVLLLDSGADIHHKSKEGVTAIMLAAFNGHDELIELLLDRGACINDQDNKGWTPLMWALDKGYYGTVVLLCEKNADLNLRDKEEWTALMWAASGGHRDVVALLLNNGASLSPQENGGTTALIEAAAEGHTDIVALLLESGENIDFRNKQNETALISAAENGHGITVELLLRLGATIDFHCIEKVPTQIVKRLQEAQAQRQGQFSDKNKQRLRVAKFGALYNIASCKGSKRLLDRPERLSLEDVLNADEDDGNLNHCSKCWRTGELLCCDDCPRSFHVRCLGNLVKDIPEGHWTCYKCSQEQTDAFVVELLPGLQKGITEPIQLLDEIVGSICNHEFGPVFQESISLKQENSVNTKQQINLVTVQTKLKLALTLEIKGAQVQTSSQQFEEICDDLRQIWKHCKGTQKEHSVIWRMADHLSRLFERAFQIAILPFLCKTHPSISVHLSNEFEIDNTTEQKNVRCGAEMLEKANNRPSVSGVLTPLERESLQPLRLLERRPSLQDEQHNCNYNTTKTKSIVVLCDSDSEKKDNKKGYTEAMQQQPETSQLQCFLQTIKLNSQFHFLTTRFGLEEVSEFCYLDPEDWIDLCKEFKKVPYKRLIKALEGQGIPLNLPAVACSKVVDDQAQN